MGLADQLDEESKEERRLQVFGLGNIVMLSVRE